jgi:hypothetical protein
MDYRPREKGGLAGQRSLKISKMLQLGNFYALENLSKFDLITA